MRGAAGRVLFPTCSHCCCVHGPAFPYMYSYASLCCLVSASPFAQNQILNQMASPPTSIARKRPISATSKSQTGMDLTSASGELSSHVYGSWETGGGSLVRPDSAPPERRIRVIDKRGGSRREHTASQLQVATAASKPPELDFLLETFIDLEEVDATEHAQAGARSRQHWGDVGAKLGSIAQAAARQHNRGKGGNDRNRQTLEESSVPERRVAAGNPKISGSREVAFAWMKSAAKPGEFHNESHYQRALEQHSSPTRLRVRVTVKKPMVMSLILRSLIPAWLVDHAHGIILPLPRYASRSIICVILTGTLASLACILHLCSCASGAGGLSHSNNTTATD